MMTLFMHLYLSIPLLRMKNTLSMHFGDGEDIIQTLARRALISWASGGTWRFRDGTSISLVLNNRSGRTGEEGDISLANREGAGRSRFLYLFEQNDIM
jgi:hypothetical protein